MENKIILTKSSSESDIKSYFTAVLNLSQSSKEFPVNLDDVWPLVYGKKSDAVEALVNNNQFIQDVDYQVLRRNPQNPNGGRPITDYFLTTSCLEYFIARKVRSVFEVYRQVFHKAVATPSYQIEDPIERAQRWIEEQQEKKALETKTREQARAIERKDTEIVSLAATVTRMRPKVSYVDMVLQCKETVSTTQIAQDYGMSAKAFNILLRNHGIQHKVSGQWILYSRYLPCGYVQSDTIDITHTNGTRGVVMHTKWTQRGRLFLYDTLKHHGTLPLVETAQTGDNSNL